MEYMGETVIPHGRKRYKLKEHDSLIISGSLFIWNSKGIRGNSYNLLNAMYEYKGRQIYKVIEKFLKDIETGKYKPSETVIKEKKADNRISVKKDDYKQIEEYLVNKRKISSKIVKSLYANSLIFLDQKNNINFVIKDVEGKIKGHDLVGTGEIRFKRNTSIEHGFNIEDNPELKKETIYVFEAPIDLISYIEINKEKINERHKNEGVRFLSVSGVRTDILDNYLNKDIKNMYICTDNDEGGNKFYETIKENYKEINIHRELPKEKDWNEDLQKDKKKLENKKKHSKSKRKTYELER